MKLPAEIIYQAVFDVACSINAPQNGQPSLTPFTTMTRRWVKWDQVGDEAMPWLGQMQPPNGIKISEVRQFGPRKYLLSTEIWIYLAVDSGNLNVPNSPRLNAYFNAIDAAFQPSILAWNGIPNQSGRQQLGLGPGIEHCWIDGTVVFDEGLLEPPAILKFPISVLCG